MKDFPIPTPGLPYLAQASAQQLDQIHDRIMNEVQFHERNADTLGSNDVPNVELDLEEARLALGNLARISQLLRAVSEGAI